MFPSYRMMSNDDWEAQSFLHNSLDNLPVNLNSPSGVSYTHLLLYTKSYTYCNVQRR